MTKFFHFLFSIFYFPTLMLAVVAGCTPASQMLASRSPSAISFNMANYTPLVSYCDSNQIQWEWDPVANVVTLEGKSSAGKFLVDSPVGMVDSQRVQLAEPLRIQKGEILFPVSSLPLLESLNAAKALPPISPGQFQIRTVILDPGHGGKDPGAVGRSGTQEKEIVLDVSLRVRDLLTQKGLEVVMTRERDQFISLGRRAEIANRNGGDFFISLHANSSRSRSASGFEVYHLSKAVDDEARALAALENAVLELEEESFSGRSQDLDATLWDIVNDENRTESAELAKELVQSASARLGVRDRGVKSARFAVLKGTMMPSVLIEVGFITNPEEEERLQSADYRQRLAEAIVDGILSYKSHYEKTEGFTR